MACCTDAIKLRPNHNLNSVNELHRLLQALMATKFRHKYLLKVASTYARDNKGILYFIFESIGSIWIPAFFTLTPYWLELEFAHRKVSLNLFSN